MLALRSPELEILGITVVSGNVPAKKGASNAQKVLHWMNRPDIPVYLGEELPLVRPYVDAMDTHGEDGLGESHYPEITDGTINTDGVASLPVHCMNADPKGGAGFDHCSGTSDKPARLVQNDPESLAGLGELISMGAAARAMETALRSQSTTTGAIRMPQKLYYRAFEELPVLQDKQIHMVDWM